MGEPERTRKLKIYQDELKPRHTTHWDLDYLGAQDYEAVMKGDRPMPGPRRTTEGTWLDDLMRRIERD